MSAIESETQRFECSKLGGAAYVQLNYASRHGQRLSRGEVGNCDGAKKCGVRADDGSFDWSKCVHPLSPVKR